MEVSGQRNVLAALSPEKEPSSIHWIGGWVRPRVGFDSMTEQFPASVWNPTPITHPVSYSLYGLSCPGFYYPHGVRGFIQEFPD